MASADRPAPTHRPSFRPTASLETLRLRSELLALTREFFRSRRFCEVETPLLSRDTVVDANLEPFVTREADNPSQARPEAADELFLQTSPEFAMKRLLASGASAVFQVTRAFRRGEIGSRHNPEFTIVEWYRVGSTYVEQMDLTQDFVLDFCRYAASADPKRQEPSPGRPPLQAPFERMTYNAAFERFLGRPVIGLKAAQLHEIIQSCGIEPPPSLLADDVDGWLNLLLALAIEPELAKLPAVFLYDYPSGQSALAHVRGEVAERFELYLNGIEICNGYQELTDPNELRQRIAAQSALRQREGRRPLPCESRLLDAMEFGLPPCAGVALGFDRLMMAALGAPSMADVMAFPFDRA